MRIGELFSVHLADCKDTYCIGGEKTDAGKNRVIPIPLVARPIYNDLRAGALGCDRLIDGYAGQRVANNFRKRDFDALLKRLDLDPKLTPHSTRHTFTARAVKQGVPPEKLKKILGHTNYSTTIENYDHADADDLVSAVESLH